MSKAFVSSTRSQEMSATTLSSTLDLSPRRQRPCFTVRRTGFCARPSAEDCLMPSCGDADVIEEVDELQCAGPSDQENSKRCTGGSTGSISAKCCDETGFLRTPAFVESQESNCSGRVECVGNAVLTKIVESTHSDQHLEHGCAKKTEKVETCTARHEDYISVQQEDCDSRSIIGTNSTYGTDLLSLDEISSDIQPQINQTEGVEVTFPLLEDLPSKSVSAILQWYREASREVKLWEGFSRSSEQTQIPCVPSKPCERGKSIPSQAELLAWQRLLLSKLAAETSATFEACGGCGRPPDA